MEGYALLQLVGGKWVLRAETGFDVLDEAEAHLRRTRPGAFDGPHRIEMLKRSEIIEAASAARSLAEQLAAETGLPVRYSDHGAFCLSRGPLVRTDLDPTAEAMAVAWQSMGDSYWSQPDRSTSATGKPYFESDD